MAVAVKMVENRLSYSMGVVWGSVVSIMWKVRRHMIWGRSIALSLPCG